MNRAEAIITVVIAPQRKSSRCSDAERIRGGLSSGWGVRDRDKSGLPKTEWGDASGLGEGQ